MDIRLDKNSPIPVGVQVKEQIKMLINSGACKEGEKLPSINHLAAFLGVNKNTVVTVLKDLQTEGYIDSQRGKGVFVSKRVKSAYDRLLIEKVDNTIKEAKKQKIGANELVNLINARFSRLEINSYQKALFVIGISQELVEMNVQKLRENIPDIQFEGLFLNKGIPKETMLGAMERAHFIIVPAIIYEYIKSYLPKDKPVIKTMANLKLLQDLNKGIEKKSRVGIIGVTESGVQALANMFLSAGLFRPRLLITVDQIEKAKKELKDVDSLVVCASAREAFEKFKFKDKTIYYFWDYLDDGSIKEIRNTINKI
ncbi:MAG: GntR family transcriptional regulator [Clostridia bacterium]|nr:GntR family transcriptional regulator [Clostridia bacterium]